MVKLYYEEAKRVQGEPEGMASMSEMEPQNDARVIAHGAQGNAQVEALEAQVQEMKEESPRKKCKRMKKSRTMIKKINHGTKQKATEQRREQDCKLDEQEHDEDYDVLIRGVMLDLK